MTTVKLDAKSDVWQTQTAVKQTYIYYIVLPLQLLRTNRKQANQSAIQANWSTIQANQSALQAYCSAIQSNQSAIEQPNQNVIHANRSTFQANRSASLQPASVAHHAKSSLGFCLIRSFKIHIR